MMAKIQLHARTTGRQQRQQTRTALKSLIKLVYSYVLVSMVWLSRSAKCIVVGSCKLYTYARYILNIYIDCLYRAKYVLATVNNVIQVYGSDQMIGYDIGCSFSATIKVSSISKWACKEKLLCCVNAFHGHVHKRICQLSHHPLYLPGLGLEDLETCERIFSASNVVAHLVRHASYYHWLQFLDLHFDSWNQD